MTVLLWNMLACQIDKPTDAPSPPPTPSGLIAFYSDRNCNNEIDSVCPDGTGLKRSTNHPAEDNAPVFSADGRQIAFASNRRGRFEVYVMRSDGSDRRWLTNPASDKMPSAWTPDGTETIYTAILDLQTSRTEVHVMNADGSNDMTLSTPGAVNEDAYWSPRWSAHRVPELTGQQR